MKEMCYHICINTRLIATTAAYKKQLAVLDLTIKFFNTYLRASINLNDPKIVYNTLFQYRQLGEVLVDKTKGNIIVP